MPERAQEPAAAQAVVLSALDEDRLRESAARLRDDLSTRTDADLAGIAYTLQVGREPM